MLRDSTVYVDEDGEEEKGISDLPSRRGSTATDKTFMLYTPDEERSVVRKFDRRLVLFIALLYILSFLDRSSKCRLSFERDTDKAQMLGMLRSLDSQQIYIQIQTSMTGFCGLSTLVA